MKRRRQGHFCRICDRMKPHNKFSGKGHRTHICKECSKRPKSEISAIEHEKHIFNFMSQSRISDKNISRLKTLVKTANQKNSKLAKIVLEVARFCPVKKRRIKFLAKKKPGLLVKLIETGLIEVHCDNWYFQVPTRIFRLCEGLGDVFGGFYDENDGFWVYDDFDVSDDENDGFWVYDDAELEREEQSRCKVFDVNGFELI